MTLSRRSVLEAGACAATLTALAGCADDAGGANSRGYAAFFTLWDWAENVGGEEFPFENPVDVGEMGHGWEPEGDLLRNVAASELFVYLDTPEFAWAQDAAGQLEADYDDVAVVDLLAGMEDHLLPWQDAGRSSRAPDRDHDWDPESVQVAEFEVIVPRTGEASAYWHNGHWHGGLPEIPVDGTTTVEGYFEDDAGRVLPLGEDQPFQFGARFVTGADEDPITIESLGNRVRFHGNAVGRTYLVFELRSDGEVIWDTSNDPIAADVSEEVEGATEFVDPHVWVDPVLAQALVDNIADALVEVDPDNAATYRDNADAYKTELAEVDAAFQRMADEAERDVAVLAGHDSFGYVEDRYDFDLHTPVGVSPDEEPSQNDIADTIAFVDEHDIDVILYDHFESPNLAETIVDNSTATETATVTPAEGTTEEWRDQGYGYVEQLLKVTVPSFRRALGAD